MIRQDQLKVAVLLATYNGERYVEEQIRSLADNQTKITLHWLDDHSTDETRDLVRAASRCVGIELKEWHQPQHIGIPAAFFQILECVEADVYLFCDQDDIWQEGKIDAAVASLSSDLASPAMYFTDILIFSDDRPGTYIRGIDLLGVGIEVALQESRLFMSAVGSGNCQAFTRPLRDIYMKHKTVARAYASMHDLWMYTIAVASGKVIFGSSAPTTLYRWHGGNWSANFVGWNNDGPPRIRFTWEQHRLQRRGIALRARGFILASDSMPKSKKLERSLNIAKSLSGIDKRQTLATVVRLVRRRVMWPNNRAAIGMATSCLLCGSEDGLVRTQALIR